MRLIDGDELRQVLEVYSEKDSLGHTPVQLCDAMPTIDAVVVVRCKDCKNLGENDGYYFCNAIGIAFGDKPNWFCADGEVKSDGN